MSAKDDDLLHRRSLLKEIHDLREEFIRRIDKLVGTVSTWTPRDYVVDIMIPPTQAGQPRTRVRFGVDLPPEETFHGFPETSVPHFGLENEFDPTFLIVHPDDAPSFNFGFFLFGQKLVWPVIDYKTGVPATRFIEPVTPSLKPSDSCSTKYPWLKTRSLLSPPGMLVVLEVSHDQSTPVRFRATLRGVERVLEPPFPGEVLP